MRRQAGRRAGLWRARLWALGGGMLALAAGAPVPARSQAGESLPVRKLRLQVAGSLNEALEHARSYQPIAWTDPSGGSTGAITVYSPILQGERPCRNFKYVVRAGSEEITDSGLRCRQRGGLWLDAGVPDRVAVRALAPIPLAPLPLAPVPLQPPAAIPAPPPDPLLAQLQANLIRLAYDAGPADGTMHPGFADALRVFEADEGVAPTADPVRRDLALSAAAVARAQVAGSCAPLADVQAATLVCGRRR